MIETDINMRELLVLYQGMNREQRRAHFKKNRKELEAKGFTWEYITSKLDNK